jgi:hypothetical protein
MEALSISRYRRKPQSASDDGQITAARYQHGEPLDDLREVAAMAYEGEIAECALPSGSVLVVAWTDIGDSGARKTYDTVIPGDWLVYSHGNGSLFDDDSAGIEQFYEPVP